MSELYINKSEKSAKLLTKWPIDKTPLTKKKALVGEPRAREKPQKVLPIETTIINKHIIFKKNLDKEQLEIAMSIIKCNNKIHKPLLYDKAINDPVYRQYWRKAIENELQNLKNHQM